MKSEISVYFAFFGFDTDPDEITRIVGISPSRIRRVGDAVSYPPPPGKDAAQMPRVKVSGWRIDSGLDPAADLPTQVRALLRRLQPAWASLTELGQRYEAAVECVVKSYGGDRPEIGFDKDLIQQVAQLNATLGVDLYIFP